MFGRWFLKLLGVAAVLGALFAAAIPLGLTAVDRTGDPIPCGNALRPAYDIAAKQDLLNLDQHTLVGPTFAKSDYAQQCAERVGDRRTTAMWVAGAGVAVLLIVFAAPQLVRAVSSRRGGQAQDARPSEPVGDQPNHARVGAQRLADQVGPGVTQPILEKTLGEQIGRDDYAAVAAAALR